MLTECLGTIARLAIIFLCALGAIVQSTTVAAESRAAVLAELRSEYVRLRNIDPTTDDGGVLPLWRTLARRMNAQITRSSLSSFEETRLAVDTTHLFLRLFVSGRNREDLEHAEVLADILRREVARGSSEFPLQDEIRILLGDIELFKKNGELARKEWSRGGVPNAESVRSSRIQSSINGTFDSLLPSSDLGVPQVLRVGPADMHLPRKGRRSQKLIVIDPGHGGDDAGAVGKYGLVEKDVTLDLAQRLRVLLVNEGFKVALTRSNDTFVPLARRTKLANQLNASVFVSLHHNASPSHALEGLESYYLDNTDDQAGRKLAERENSAGVSGSADDIDFMLSDLIQTGKLEDSIRLTRGINSALAATLGQGSSSIKVRGVKKAPFYVLVGAHMPCTLIEMLFIDNADDASKLVSHEFRDHAVQALARGITHFLGEEIQTELSAPERSERKNPSRLERPTLRDVSKRKNIPKGTVNKNVTTRRR